MFGNADPTHYLISAVREGRLQRVRELINEFGLSHSKGWSDGYVLLRHAIENKHTAIIKLLITSGSKVNVENQYFFDTPLHLAVRNANKEIVEMLVDNGAGINTKNRFGKTPFDYAIADEKMDIIELLLNRGAFFTDRGNKGKTLCVAADEGNLRIAEHLLNFGVDIDFAYVSRSKEGYTPLCFAVEEARIEMIDFLLSRGANIDAGGKAGITPLHIAVERRHFEIVKCLLKRGACIDSALTSSCRKGYTPLCIAVQHCNEEMINFLLSKGANINAKGNFGVTPLHIAIDREHYQIVEHLLKAGACIDSEYISSRREGYTPLCLAVETDNNKIIQLLLRKGANINGGGQNGITPLHVAVDRGNFMLAESLLRDGAYVDSVCTSTGYTPLLVAVEKKHTKIVKLLLENGANFDAEDNNGKSVLHLAVEKEDFVIVWIIFKCCPRIDKKSNRRALSAAVLGRNREHDRIVKHMLNCDFNVNPEEINNNKLLYAAVTKGYSKIVEQLLQYGADANMIYNSEYKVNNTPFGYFDVCVQDCKNDLNFPEALLTERLTAKGNNDLLSIAVRKDYKEIVKALLEHGANVNLSDKYGRTPLHFTAISEEFVKHFFNTDYPDKNIRADIAQLLLDWGANINAEIENGVTTLHIATYKGDKKLVEVLLKYKADVNSTLKNGKTPLHISIKQNGHVTKMLLEAETKVNPKLLRDRTIPLHIGSYNGREEIIECLLMYGAKVDYKVDNQTPLHIAAEYGYTKIVEILIKFGADVDSRDEYGRTALHIASKKGRVLVVDVLVKLGSNVSIECKDGYTALDNAKACFNRPRHNIRINDDSIDDDDGFYDDYNERVASNNGSYEEIIETLQLHIIKLKAANLYVTKRDLLLIDFEDFVINQYMIKCKKEIEGMKSVRFNNVNVSLYDILMKNTSVLAIYAGNENVVQGLKLTDYKVQFPIYAGIIENKFKKAELRKALLEQSNTYFNSLFIDFPALLCNCIDKILAYLPNDDLRSIIEACEPTNVGGCIMAPALNV